MRPLRAAFSYERSTHLDDQSVAADPTRLGGVIEPPEQLVGEVDTRYRARLSTYQNLLTSAIEANHQGSKVTLNVTAGQVCYIVVDGCNSGFQLERDPTVVGTERGEQRDPVVLGRTGVSQAGGCCVESVAISATSSADDVARLDERPLVVATRLAPPRAVDEDGGTAR